MSDDEENMLSPAAQKWFDAMENNPDRINELVITIGGIQLTDDQEALIYSALILLRDSMDNSPTGIPDDELEEEIQIMDELFDIYHPGGHA